MILPSDVVKSLLDEVMHLLWKEGSDECSDLEET
jgi:hypothetical protein